MDSPSSGSVKLLGQELTGMREKGLARPRREHIGFVFQQINLLPQLSLLENIAVAGYLAPGVAPAEVHRVAWELLSRTGLQGIGHRLPAQVSGGEQQRVAVARALVNTPTIRNEKRLPRYGTGDPRDREAAVVSWLTRLGW
jgi:putative ABC transport system ATP-binding protein